MIRLSQYLQRRGIASRRKCDALISSGKVQVNGKTILEAYFRVSDADLITVNGQKIKHEEPKVTYILNKPRGTLCTAARSKNSKSVLELFDSVPYRLFTVGRLDKESTGLLIVTNDGAFAHRIMHPSFEIHKEYLVKADKEITDIHLRKISSGTEIENCFVKPLKVSKVRKSNVKITVAEGKKHEVRLLIQAAGLEVKELKRIRIGGLHLGKLPEGAWRPMTGGEKKAILE